MLKWERASRRKLNRCPYCVDGDSFKIMSAQPGGDWFLCGGCGHLALPANPTFQCNCGKCVQIERNRPNRLKR